MKTDFYVKKIQSTCGVGKFNSLFPNRVVKWVDKCAGCQESRLEKKGLLGKVVF